MKSGTYRQDSLLIVYDAEQVQHPRADLFDPGYWDKRGCVTGEAVGRGSAWFIDAPFGAVVLRRYLRGGLIARISRDRYLFTGWARSRPVAEFRVLERLAAAGLPVPEKESWYVQTGQGMLATINIAAERNGYTMTDRGTYIKYESNLKGNPPLKILVEGDAVLLNQYSVIAINPKHCAKANYDTAQQFIKWIAGPEAQKLINDFKLLGKPLFTPNADM